MLTYLPPQHLCGWPVHHMRPLHSWLRVSGNLLTAPTSSTPSISEHNRLGAPPALDTHERQSQRTQPLSQKPLPHGCNTALPFSPSTHHNKNEQHPQQHQQTGETHEAPELHKMATDHREQYDPLSLTIVMARPEHTTQAHKASCGCPNLLRMNCLRQGHAGHSRPHKDP